MKLGSFLLALVEPMVGRVLVTLGFSVVSFVGFNAVVGQVQQMLVDRVNALPADMLNVFLLAGGGVGLSLIASAIAVRVLMWQAMNSKKILGANPQ